jgi:phage terminase small subunit
MKNRKAPKHLRATTRAWWSQVVADYQLEPHHALLLTAACECLDRIAEAQEAVTAEGLFPVNGRGRKLHPALLLERDQKILFARLLRELSLDIEAPAEQYARVPRISGRYDQ